jgi:chitodextrinase
MFGRRRRPDIRRSMPLWRRPPAATLVAVLAVVAIGSQASFAASSSPKDQGAPAAVSEVEVSAADASSVTIEWPPSRDSWMVAGYGVFVDAAQVATLKPERVHRWRNKDSYSYTVRGLSCGRGYTIGVDAFDRGDDHSEVTSTTVSTSACPDSAAPSVPSGVRQVATTETSVVLAWTPSTDNVGVVAYGLYDSGLRVSTVNEASATVVDLACGKTYLLGIDAADAAGNRSARVDSYFRTSACPRTNQPPSTPTGVRVTSATQTGLEVGWTASTDDVGVAGYGVYVAGSKASETPDTSTGLTSLTCGTTYTVGVDAFDGAGKRSSIAQLSTATSACSSTPPPSSTGVVTQTIGNGSTIANVVGWRAVYDRNGDKVEDDPGKIEFYVDGKQVLSEINPPFGDTFADGTITVANGSHTFEVRALTDAGTLLAKNTVTATVGNPTTPPPPPGDSVAPSKPDNLRVMSASPTDVTVGWSASTDNVAVAGYGLYRGTNRTGQTAQTTAKYSGLTCGTAYQVGVDAYDAAGNRSSRADVAVTTTACADTQPPTVPTNVTVSTRTSTSIALTWTSSTDNVGVAGYGVYNGGELAATTTGTSGIVSGLACGASYTLAVDAFDASGNSSAKTTPMMVSTMPCTDTTPPTQPTNLRATSTTATSLAIAWNASTDTVGVAGYDVYRANVKVGSSVPTTSYTLNGLSCATTYSIAVAARDSAGNTSPQATLQVTTSACQPPPAAASCPLPAYPDASCTGVPPGTTLTPRQGPITVTTAGAVLQNLDITYTGSEPAVSVNAPNVTIRNVRVRSNGIALIQVNVGGSLLIEDSELINQPAAGQPNCHNGIATGSYTARRLEIRGCENGAEMFRGNVVFEDNYVHDLDNVGPSYVFGNEAPHSDGVQLNGGATNVVIRHNTIDPIPSGERGGTSGIIGNTSGDNVRIEDNTIDGGGSSYAIYVPRTAKSAWFVNRNRLGRGVWGYTACVKVGNTVTQFDQNTDAATGAAIAPDNGFDGSCTN